MPITTSFDFPGYEITSMQGEILGMRFDSGAIGQWSEICAYGTGVTVEPVTDYARQQFEYMTATGGMPQQGDYNTQVSEWSGPAVGAGGTCGSITSSR